MIRIIFFFLVTLMLSCSNARPEPATEPEETTAGATEVPTPEPLREAVDTAVENPDDAAASAAGRTGKKASPAKKAQPAPAVIRTTAEVPADVAADTDSSPSPADTAPAADSADADSADAEQTAGQKPAEAAKAPQVPQTPVWTLVEEQKGTKNPRFLPTRRRIDREIDKLKFAYKGEVMCGLTASYGTLSSDDTDFMLIIDNIDASGTIATVKPFVGYFYRDNNCVGVRFGYKYVNGKIDNAILDLGEKNDITMDIPYINLRSNNYSFGIFHRSYAGLDPKGRFGLFAEFELALSSGTSEFTYESGNDRKYTSSDNTKVGLSFNPGAAVYIFPNVCATLSFGLGGIQYTSVTQKDAEGNRIGTRKASNMKFKLNLAAINFGMTIHLWDKKKK